MQVLGRVPKGASLISYKFLKRRIGSGKYGVSKWIKFCLFMLGRGYLVFLYEARHTNSKYVTVLDKLGRQFTVRFSDHAPIKARELKGDCDYFVGKTHTGTRNTDGAIKACLKAFGEEYRTKFHKVVKEKQDKVEEEITGGAT